MTPLRARLPSKPGVAWTTNVSDLFGGGSDDLHLFQSGGFKMNASGFLLLDLKPFRFGEVEFNITLMDSDGTDQMGYNVSATVSFILEVVPVNQEPTFDLNSSTIQIAEGESISSSVRGRSYISNITKGGWEEYDQALFWTVEIAGGPFLPEDIVVEIECDGNTAEEVAQCSAGTASFAFQTTTNKFGIASLQLSLHDDGGAVGRRILDVEVVPSNDEPSFQLASEMVIVVEDSSCITRGIAFGEWLSPGQALCDTSVPFYHERGGFATFISMGPLENGINASDCNSGITCESQTGIFVLTPWDSTVASYVFDVMPAISFPEGKLIFTLSPAAHGEVTFNVTLRDQNAYDQTSLVTTPLQFTILVVDTNSPPSFMLVGSEVTVAEDSGPYISVGFAANMSTDGRGSSSEPNQTYTFTLVPDDVLTSVDDPLTISVNGTLTFTPGLDLFGVTRVRVLLLDDGGSVFGGKDKSQEQVFILTVLAVNDIPVFSLGAVLPVAEASGVHRIPGFATGISPGPSNEVCSVPSVFCQAQTVTFVVDDSTNPTIFEHPPAISPDGTLTFKPAEAMSGTSIVTIRLVDDGGFDSVIGAVDTTARYSFRVDVVPTDQPPAYDLPRDVSCVGIDLIDRCSCLREAKQMGICANDVIEDSPVATSEVRILEGAGEQYIAEYATKLTPKEGQYHFSRATFDIDQNGDVSFDSLGQDELGLDPLYAYSSGFVVSSDGNYAYSTEFETDLVTAYRLENGDIRKPTIIDKIGNNMVRFRFNGFGATGDDFGEAKFVGPHHVCGWESFEMDGRIFVMAATGCQLLSESTMGLPNGTCSADVLSSTCGQECCEDLFSTVVGNWDFSTPHIFGKHRVNPLSGRKSIECTEEFCTFSRPQNTAACSERYPVTIGPATFRDIADTLGAAIMMGAACKVGRGSDWDGSSLQDTPSVATFLVNDGVNEALQFDGSLNKGLVVSENIDLLVDGNPASSKLPLEHITIDAWFTIDNTKPIAYAGLAAAQQDGPGCRKGWHLAYSRTADGTTTFTFQISVEAKDTTGFGSPSYATFSSTSIDMRTWYHIAAVYDGVYVSMYLDGVLVDTQPACDSQEGCGNIIYAASYQPTGDGGCLAGLTSLSIGTYSNPKSASSFPHFGAMKNFRIFNKGLSETEILELYALHSSTLKPSAMQETEFWTKALGQETGLWSPSTDVSDGLTPTPLTVRGLFDRAKRYRCLFVSKAGIAASEDANITCSASGCAPGYADTLTCVTPLWAFGYSATTLSIQTPSSTDPSTWVSLWQKVCLTSSCGFLPVSRRSSSDWWVSGSRNLLNPGLEGTETKYRFSTTSALFAFNNDTEDLLQTSSLPSTAGCLGGSCIYMQRICQGGASDGQVCAQDADCAQPSYCSDSELFRLLGVRSFTHFSKDSKQYLLAANFWDGETSKEANLVQSPLFELELVGASVQATFLQSVTTEGALVWKEVSVDGISLLGVANHAGYCSFYRWLGGVRPLDEENVFKIQIPMASDMDVFEVMGVTFVAVAAYSADPSIQSQIVMLGVPFNATHSSFGGDIVAHTWSGDFMSAVVIQTLDIPFAHDVEHFTSGGVRFLAFASLDLSGPSLLYACDETLLPPSFELVQELPTTGASSLAVFETAGVPYLLVTQIGDNSQLLRWNGTIFLGAFDKGTLPKDVAAGQTIGYASILTSHVFQSSITDVRYAVFGTYRNSLDPEEDSILLREFAVNVVAMDGPSVILFSGDGRFLYVSCVYSRSIITFSRSSTTGLIGFDGNLSLVTPWSSSPVTDTDPEESRLAKELFGYPVRGVTSMVFDSSETHVYATNFLDGAVVVLKRNLMTGRLSVLQVISNGMEHRGLSVTGLIGAHGLSLSTTEERVYVTAYVDQAVSTFRRLNDGTLEFRDRMKNGERALWDFKDSAAALGLAQAWDEGEYPMRLGGNNEDWSFTARASKHFAIDGTHYLVVAAGDVNPIAQNGAAVVYRFSEATSTFQWLQTTVNDPGASSVVYFRIKTAGLPDKHFFAVGNSRNRGSTTGRVNIYRFNDQTGRFDYDRYLNLAPDEVNPTLFPSDLVHFDMEGEQYLAVSNLWDGTTEFVRSYIYRWNPGRVRDPGSGIHIDIGFEPWQLIQTSGAVSVDFWTDLESGVSLLVFTNANFNAQVVDIFKFNPDVQAFEPMQSIPAAYASSSRLFAIPEFGVFLAIARRQSRPIIDVVDLAAYDEASQIYKWDSETMSFEPFQELGSKF
eukprot:2403728-Rhodomonas_salina.1